MESDNFRNRIKIPEIKICGITSVREAEYLNEAGVDYAGFVFYEKSKRHIDVKKAEEIAEHLSGNIIKVAVTVSPQRDFIELLNKTGFDIVQIHGNIERKLFKYINKPVWRAVNIKDISELVSEYAFENITEGNDSEKVGMLKDKEEILPSGLVMDAPDFGSGKTFDWTTVGEYRNMLEKLRSRYRLILAGGLNGDNVCNGIKFFSPDVVDISSGVEGDKGKDRNKILEFVKAVKSV
ncbi:MAG: phosphoribosylanthranilate isomerase [Lachnospiraceae bacterium]|nr:phosphoribosylanthranilate isomerase [Lachnospiraceae bacterium]